MSLFGNLHYNTVASMDAVGVADAKSQARSAQDKAAELREQVDKLTLVCAAMWELIKEKTGLTE